MLSPGGTGQGALIHDPTVYYCRKYLAYVLHRDDGVDGTGIII